MGWTDQIKSAMDKDDLENVREILDRPEVVSEVEKEHRNHAFINVMTRSIRKEKKEVFQILLERGKNFDTLDKGGITPLHAACITKSLGQVRALLDAGADVNVRSGKSGDMPLHIAAQKRESKEIVDALIAAGGKISSKNDRGRTPLHEAADTGQLANAMALVGAGAKINAMARDKRKKSSVTPLHLAVRYRNTELVAALLKFGANPDLEGNYEDLSGSAYDFAKQMFNKYEFKDSLAAIIKELGTYKRNKEQLALKYGLKKGNA